MSKERGSPRSGRTAATVVAVLDGGLLFGHEDLLAGRHWKSGGYDFISDATVANDGDGRDSNPADPGNWVSSTESGVGVFANCPPLNSSCTALRSQGYRRDTQ